MSAKMETELPQAGFPGALLPALEIDTDAALLHATSTAAQHTRIKFNMAVVVWREARVVLSLVDCVVRHRTRRICRLPVWWG